MPTEKTSKKGDGARKPKRGTGGVLLRGDPRHERRYVTGSSLGTTISIVAMSLGAVAVGAGTYGQWVRRWIGTVTEPHPYAPYLLVAGSIVLLGVALLGSSGGKIVRIGDAGVALEAEDGELDRIPWREVEHVVVNNALIRVEGEGTTLEVPIGRRPAAAARLLFEAKRRVPGKLENPDDIRIDVAGDDDAEVITLEAPQAAGERCKSTDKLISFEKDARYCAACGEVYHRDGIPDACMTCGAHLKG